MTASMPVPAEEERVACPSPAALGSAIERAVAFLLQTRGSPGWWHDYDTLAGCSDEWVSAYVACALAESGRHEALRKARQVWHRLRLRRWWSRGWGYNRRVPADADSTLWVLALAGAVDVSRSVRVARARSFVGGHTREDGSVATYATAGPIRLFTRLGPNDSFRGWCAPHVCVTALAATLDLPARERTLGFLRRSQAREGCWEAYWWCDPEYSTALAVRALSERAAGEDDGRLARAADWAAWRANDASASRSPFVTALRLSILTARPHRRWALARDACLSRLLEAQREDGSWLASARLRIPPPHVVDPESYPRWLVGGRGGGSIVLDSAGYYTAATVLAALVRAERADARG